MCEFMGQQSCFQHVQCRVEERSLTRRVIARLVMLDPVMSNLVAERKQEVVLPVVPGSKKFPSFGYQTLIGRDIFFGHCQIGIGITYEIDEMFRNFAGSA